MNHLQNPKTFTNKSIFPQNYKAIIILVWKNATNLILKCNMFNLKVINNKNKTLWKMFLFTLILLICKLPFSYDNNSLQNARYDQKKKKKQTKFKKRKNPLIQQTLQELHILDNTFQVYYKNFQNIVSNFHCHSKFKLLFLFDLL